MLELPTIEIHPNDNFSNECDITEKWIQKNVEDTETQNENQKAEMHIDMAQKLSDVLLNDYQYVVFTSPSGVNCFFDQLKKENINNEIGACVFFKSFGLRIAKKSDGKISRIEVIRAIH